MKAKKAAVRKPLTETAHVKGFETIYYGDTSTVRWVEVRLQVLVADGREAGRFCRLMARNMDRKQPRRLTLTETRRLKKGTSR